MMKAEGTILKRISRVSGLPGVAFFLVALIGFLAPDARATVAVSPLYGSNMVIQRDQPFPVHGTAAPNKVITITYNNQTTNTTADAQGNWQVSLAPMSVKTAGSNFTIVEQGGNTITLSNVVVGDVWLFSGQSNMGIDMNFCNQPADIAGANYPGIRCFGFVPLANSATPAKTFNGAVNWTVCSPSSAGGFSAVAFYFGRAIYTNQNGSVPLGLVVSCVGGTSIDLWLDPEGLTDIPTLSPLFSQASPANGAFSLFNGMIYPLAPYPVKGVIWYQGENAELTTQSADSYYLKEKALITGWKQLLGVDDCAFYLVQIASWGTEPTSPAPVLNSGGWNADTRLQQGNALNLPHAGVASAIDIGDSSTGADIWYGWHPTNKWDVGYRLSLWALKNEYDQPDIVPSGPVLRGVSVAGNTATCTFDYAGAGLMAGFKPMYGPTQPTNAALALFSIAGVDGTWYWATATIVGSNTVQLTSPSVSAPRKVAYACWQNPVGANLYNSNGLPALPFYVEDVTAKYTITASAGGGGHISAPGATTYLKRMTALYTITPDAGQFIQDVRVDGVSVGAVAQYAFDPLYASHTIAVTFTNAPPVHTVNATAAPGGVISPAGAVSVTQGAAQSFVIIPNPGCSFQLTVDGKPMGPRDHFLFSQVVRDHSIAAAFYCSINASAGFGGAISSPGVTSVGYGSNLTYAITPASGYSIRSVTVDGTNVGAVANYNFTNVTTSHTISASFTGGTGGGSVPQTNQLLFACLTDSLHTNTSGTITSWPTYLPANGSLAPMGSPPPTLAVIDGRPFAANHYASAPAGFNQGAYAAPLPCNGASIVVVAKPVRNGIAGGWGCVVDAFYNRLSLGVLNDSGKIFVLRNGDAGTSATSIPDGQTTILSLVVQPNGQYGVWANGTLIYTNSATSPFTSLVNGVAGGFANNISLGNNYPDGWSTFNGDIGDVFFYTNALANADRLALEQYLATRLTGAAGTNHTIHASAETGGTIAPAGDVLVPAGMDQNFVITPFAGASISNVVVDGVSQGVVPTFTFTNVAADHTINVTFAPAAAPGGVISINYCQANDLLPPSAVAGAMATNFWNNIVWGSASSYASPTNIFFDCGGAAVPGFTVTLSKDGFDTWNSGNSSQPNPTLFADWALTGGGTLALGGVPYASYDLYVYFNGYNGVNVVDYTIGSDTQRLTDSGNLAYQFTPPFVQGTDYVKFTGLTGSNQVMTVAGVSGGFAYGLAALQVVQQVVTCIITATAGAGGTINPSGSVPVAGGSNQVFYITANPGYAVSNVVVDGISQGAVSSYAFTNVAGPHVITASFTVAPLPPPRLTIAPDGIGGLRITWPDAYGGVLLTSPVVGVGAVWTPVEVTPEHVDGEYQITITPGADAAFYGLSE